MCTESPPWAPFHPFRGWARSPAITYRHRAPVGWHGQRRHPLGHPVAVFFLFSNRLGCLGSLLVSAVLTLILLFVLDVL